jgi:hypothetical protein
MSREKSPKQKKKKPAKLEKFRFKALDDAGKQVSGEDSSP